MPEKQNLEDVLTSYLDATKKVSTAADVFLQHANLLNQARNEYRKAVMASGELRNALNSGEENLRALMTQLEKAVSNPVVTTLLGEKELEPTPEVVMTEAAKPNGAKPTVMKAFP